MPSMSVLRSLKQRLANWLLSGVELEELRVRSIKTGERTVTLGNHINVGGGRIINIGSNNVSFDDAGVLDLAGIPDTLTGKDADSVDGKHASDFALASHTHTNADLVTATGSASASLASGELLDVTMNEYTFFPNVYTSASVDDATTLRCRESAAPGTTGAVRIYGDNTAGASVYVDWRYITSSRKAVIAVILSERGKTAYWASEPILDDSGRVVFPMRLGGKTHDELMYEVYETELYNCKAHEPYAPGRMLIEMFKEETIRIRKLANAKIVRGEIVECTGMIII
ncbi:MAG: hypothetical protein ACXQTZ_05065 [Candidatus Alkanophagales archaeon]